MVPTHSPIAIAYGEDWVYLHSFWPHEHSCDGPKVVRHVLVQHKDVPSNCVGASYGGNRLELQVSLFYGSVNNRI